MINVAIIGATGLVGQELLLLLEKKEYIKASNIFLFASKDSIKKKRKFKDSELPIYTLNEQKILKNIQIAFFCAGNKISKKYIPFFIRKKIFCIDLSSAYRLKKEIPLIIPEINKQQLNYHKYLVSSPNCTTTIMLLPLYPLHKKFNLKQILLTTYQAFSGAGAALVKKLKDETLNVLTKKNYSSYHAFNLFPHESKENKKGFCEEEAKVIKETHKILNSKIEIIPTCIRVPILRAHSLSIKATFNKKITKSKIISILEQAQGVEIFKPTSSGRHATPFDATFKKSIFCSKIITYPKNNMLNLWIVGDQLLKGAALNAFQIFELFIKNQQNF